MKMLRNFLRSVMFKRVLVIFMVGLVSRYCVNSLFDINVFKEYTNIISLLYYVGMSWFTVVIHGLPQISLNIFDIKMIRDSIKVLLEGSFSMKDKMLSGDNIFTDNSRLEKELRESDLVCKRGSDEVTSGWQRRFKSAGVRGLYGDPNNRGVVNENSDYSFRNKVKSRLLWSCWKQFSGDYSSYKEYYESFRRNQKISLVSELKKGLRK